MIQDTITFKRNILLTKHLERMFSASDEEIEEEFYLIEEVSE